LRINFAVIREDFDAIDCICT
jgi:hypothetical protein